MALLKLKFLFEYNLFLSTKSFFMEKTLPDLFSKIEET